MSSTVAADLPPAANIIPDEDEGIAEVYSALARPLDILADSPQVINTIDFVCQIELARVSDRTWTAVSCLPTWLISSTKRRGAFPNAS